MKNIALALLTTAILFVLVFITTGVPLGILPSFWTICLSYLTFKEIGYEVKK